MPIQTNAKPITRIYKGEVKVWEDEKGQWREFDYGPTISGPLLYKINNDTMTMDVTGIVKSSQAIGTGSLVFKAPDGYKFSNFVFRNSLIMGTDTSVYDVYNGMGNHVTRFAIGSDEKSVCIATGTSLAACSDMDITNEVEWAGQSWDAQIKLTRI